MHKKKMFSNGETFLLVDDDRVLVCNEEGTSRLSCRAITIFNGFKIELGRNITNFKSALAETRLPIIIKEVALPVKSNTKIYEIIRLKTGIVDDKVIATVKEKDSKIVSIDFNYNLKYDMNYRKYNSIAICNQLSVSVKDTDSDDKVIRTMSTILKHLYKDKAYLVQCNINTNDIVLDADVEGQRQQVMFVFSSEDNRYSLASITLIE